MENDRVLDIWFALKEKPQSVDKVWDIITYSMIERWLKMVKTKIELGERGDAYSIIVMDICDYCLQNEKITMKQFKCILNYDINYNHTLKYKYKNN